MLIAITTNNPGGLEASRSEHFGHCDAFTLVELDKDKAITNVSILQNGGHEAGGCMVPVKLLHEAGADAIIVGGMGARPMSGFGGVGIEVYFASPPAIKTAGEVVEKCVNKMLPVMHMDHVCQGAGNCVH